MLSKHQIAKSHQSIKNSEVIESLVHDDSMGYYDFDNGTPSQPPLMQMLHQWVKRCDTVSSRLAWEPNSLAKVVLCSGSRGNTDESLWHTLDRSERGMYVPCSTSSTSVRGINSNVKCHPSIRCRPTTPLSGVTSTMETGSIITCSLSQLRPTRWTRTFCF